MSPKVKKNLRERRSEFRKNMADRVSNARNELPNPGLIDSVLASVEKIGVVASEKAREATDSLKLIDPNVNVTMRRVVTKPDGSKSTVKKFIEDQQKQLEVWGGKAPDAPLKKSIEIINQYEKVMSRFSRQSGTEVASGISAGVIEMPILTAKNLLESIDRQIEHLGFQLGGDNRLDSQVLVQLRQLVDENVKGVADAHGSPYRKLMKESSDHFEVKKLAKTRFGKGPDAAATSIAAAAIGRKEPLKILEDIAALRGEDGAQMIKELSELSSTKKILEKTNQLDGISDPLQKEAAELTVDRNALEAERAAKAVETPEQNAQRLADHQRFITEEIGVRWAKEAFEETEKLKNHKPASLVRAFISGWDNLEKSDTFRRIADEITENDLMKMAIARQKYDRFNKMPEGSGVAMLMGISSMGIAGLDAIAEGGIDLDSNLLKGGVGSALALGFAGAVQHLGAKRTKNVLRVLARSKKPLTLAGIESMALDKKSQSYLKRGLKDFFRNMPASAAGIVAVDPQNVDSLTGMIDRSGLKKTEKAKAISRLNKLNEVELSTYKKIVLKESEREEPTREPESVINQEISRRRDPRTGARFLSQAESVRLKKEPLNN
jgi:hypothetical protein